MHDGNPEQRLANEILRECDLRPRVAIVLGSGLSRLAADIDPLRSWNFADLTGFAPTTAIGHPGRLILGRLNGVPVVALQGRLHLYEGHNLSTIVFPVRVMRAMGAYRLILSNAAGGINPQFHVGDLMILRTHLNLLFRRTGWGSSIVLRDATSEGEERESSVVPQSPIGTTVYDERLHNEALREAHRLQLRVWSGTYAAVTGPNYETRSEYHMLRGWGVDAVGMSTVPEAVVGAHLGMQVLGISVVTNAYRPQATETVTGDDVLRVAAQSESRVMAIVRAVTALPAS